MERAGSSVFSVGLLSDLVPGTTRPLHLSLIDPEREGTEHMAGSAAGVRAEFGGAVPAQVREAAQRIGGQAVSAAPVAAEH